MAVSAFQHIRSSTFADGSHRRNTAVSWTCSTPTASTAAHGECAHGGEEQVCYEVFHDSRSRCSVYVKLSPVYRHYCRTKRTLMATTQTHSKCTHGEGDQIGRESCRSSRKIEGDNVGQEQARDQAGVLLHLSRYVSLLWRRDQYLFDATG